MVPALASLVLLSSCNKDKDDAITPTEESTYDVELIMGEDDGNKDAAVSVTSTQDSISARIYFTSTTVKMARMYFTQNVGGAGDTDFEIDATVDKKSDGSIDVVKEKSNEIEYIIKLPVPSGITQGTVVYTVWTTTARGDYRDATKNKAVGVGTITLNYGGANGSAAVKSYSATLLFAPTGDFTSKTFLSLTDGKAYAGSAGVEYAALWDFGYYNSTLENASFASTQAYEKAFNLSSGATVYDVDVLTNTPTSELNNCYFALSSKASSDFAAISTSGDLDFITQSSTEEINDLVAGNIIEFVDNYGKKGLIEVVEINGTYNQGDNIKINIKVQP